MALEKRTVSLIIYPMILESYRPASRLINAR
jgi:hypothetical protein